MIVHCAQQLAGKLPEVSRSPLEEASPLGGWHGQRFTLDRRQCVMFCHDASCYILFLRGLRKEHFTKLADEFRQLFLATLVPLGCTDVQVRKVEVALGPVRFDTATDRSVLGTLQVARHDLEVWLMRLANVMDLIRLPPPVG